MVVEEPAAAAAAVVAEMEATAAGVADADAADGVGVGVVVAAVDDVVDASVVDAHVVGVGSVDAVGEKSVKFVVVAALAVAQFVAVVQIAALAVGEAPGVGFVVVVWSMKWRL